MSANESRPTPEAAIEPTPIVGAASDKDRRRRRPQFRSVFTDIELLLTVTIGLQVVLCALFLTEHNTAAELQRLALKVVEQVVEAAR